MRQNWNFALLAAALAMPLFGCSDLTRLPLEPERVSRPQPGAPNAPAVPTPNPALPTVGDTIYARVSPSLYGSSRYVLYRNGTFSLQYFTSQFGFFQYKGTYVRTGSAVAFQWEGWSAAGPWSAEGVISGDSLTVKYNLVMTMTDFEDGVYVRTSAP